jgi:hypothetical protein
MNRGAGLILVDLIAFVRTERDCRASGLIGQLFLGFPVCIIEHLTKTVWQGAPTQTVQAYGKEKQRCQAIFVKCS